MILQNKKELIHFFNNVTIKLNIHEWKINFKESSSEGYCWKQNKTIDIGMKSSNIKQLILHEIAHINTCRFCNQKHNPSFWKMFKYLMRKFLPDQDINNSNIQMMKYSTLGFYSLVYEDRRSKNEFAK